MTKTQYINLKEQSAYVHARGLSRNQANQMAENVDDGKKSDGEIHLASL